MQSVDVTLTETPVLEKLANSTGNYWVDQSSFLSILCLHITYDFIMLTER